MSRAKTCVTCGASFESFRLSTCSRKCERRRIQERDNPKPPPRKICQRCGREFTPYHGLQRFCLGWDLRCDVPDAKQTPKPPPKPKRLRKCVECREWFAAAGGMKLCGGKCRNKRKHKLYIRKHRREIRARQRTPEYLARQRERQRANYARNPAYRERLKNYSREYMPFYRMKKKTFAVPSGE